MMDGHEGADATSAQIQALDTKFEAWKALERRVQENIDAAPSIITLDVGGTLFKTTKATLLSVEDSYFQAMLGSGLWQPDGPNNTYFLDLDPLTFHHIMAYLRHGTLNIAALSEWERTELQFSLDYLNITIPVDAFPVEEEPVEWRWDPRSISVGMKLTQGNRSVQAPWYTRWMSATGTVENPSIFCIRIDSLSVDTFVGLAPAGALQKEGYFLRLQNGHLRGPGGNGIQPYHPQGFKPGDILKARLQDGKISFAKNDEDLGVAFTVQTPSTEPLFPAFLSFSAAKVTIV
ncbi:unnamed protein product [Aphanomyces euteiches]|uniref:BTB domain-containing protein n=1 Tax=Aphanomyces euteiches TaxID=100861 RepID=A0A6G0XUD8_9STRA|nr:hypothetical protein Ae201684_001675 [Aphanomyces euteiches]KAH9075062.1 hypothetical protein Ae201684P_003747 [Aphanomyces euteiches]KAH9135991.1 hypothetical protein AeRB84_018711 [Aphanomyces euteiches]